MLTIDMLVKHSPTKTLVVKELKWISSVLPKIYVGYERVSVDTAALIKHLPAFSVHLLVGLPIAPNMSVYALRYIGAVYAFAFVDSTPAKELARIVRVDNTHELLLELDMQKVADEQNETVLEKEWDMLLSIDLLPWINKGGMSARHYRGWKGYGCYTRYLQGASLKELSYLYGTGVSDIINLFARRVSGKNIYRNSTMTDAQRLDSQAKADRWAIANPDHLTTTRL